MYDSRRILKPMSLDEKLRWFDELTGRPNQNEVEEKLLDAMLPDFPPPRMPKRG